MCAIVVLDKVGVEIIIVFEEFGGIVFDEGEALGRLRRDGTGRVWCGGGRSIGSAGRDD